MPLKPAVASRKDAMGGDASAFQHRHFAFIAATILKLRGQRMSGYHVSVARDMADAFAANPRFDRARFMKACGVGE